MLMIHRATRIDFKVLEMDFVPLDDQNISSY